MIADELRGAWARMARRPGLVVALAVLNLTVALACGEPLSQSLGPLLDDRPQAAALAEGRDDGLAVELVEDHREIIRATGSALVIGLVVYALLAAIAAAAVIESDRTDAPRAAELWATCGRHAGRTLTVGVLGLCARVAAVGAAAVIALPGGWWARGRGFGDLAAVAVVSLVALAAAWSLATVLINATLALTVRHPERAVRVALVDALAAARRRPRALWALALFSVGGWLAIGLGQWTLGAVAPWAAPLGGVLAAGARAFVGCVGLTAAAAAFSSA